MLVDREMSGTRVDDAKPTVNKDVQKRNFYPTVSGRKLLMHCHISQVLVGRMLGTRDLPLLLFGTNLLCLYHHMEMIQIILLKCNKGHACMTNRKE